MSFVEEKLIKILIDNSLRLLKNYFSNEKSYNIISDDFIYFKYKEKKPNK